MARRDSVMEKLSARYGIFNPAPSASAGMSQASGTNITQSFRFYIVFGRERGGNGDVLYYQERSVKEFVCECWPSLAC